MDQVGQGRRHHALGKGFGDPEGRQGRSARRECQDPQAQGPGGRHMALAAHAQAFSRGRSNQPRGGPQQVNVPYDDNARIVGQSVGTACEMEEL